MRNDWRPLLLVILVLFAETAAAQGKPAKLASPLFEGNPRLGKVSTDLLRARRLLRAGATATAIARALRRVPLHGGVPEVDVTLERVTPDTERALRTAGLSRVRLYPEYGRATGTIDAERLDELAAIPEITSVRPNYRPLRHAGSTTSQGDASIRADDARARFGVDGSGIGVGILSDSFDDTLGGTVSGSGCARTVTGSEPQTSGDLPPAVTLLDDGPGDGEDEGAAMGEIVHDLAPGAPLLFHTGNRGEADFAQGITELRNCGARLIVDDLIYFAEPMFQDGLIAQAATAAVGGGVAYFSAAGNESRSGVYQPFRDSNAADDREFPPTGRDFTDFGSGNRFASVRVPAGCDLLLVLQWNEPFSGALGPGASSDFDLYVCGSEDPASCEEGSFTPQGCAFGAGATRGDPLEIAEFVNDGAGARTVQVAVDHYCGKENLRFRIATFTSCDGYGFERSVFRAPEIYGHAAAAGAVAVAAAFYEEIDSGGDVQRPAGRVDVEPFSSRGGNIPFFFDGHGRRLSSPVRRFKPELAAPDGANTSFFGDDSDGDGFPNFFGTSAAAPHAAAVAALMLSANPKLSPAELIESMRATSIDVQKRGRDPFAGDGLIDAVRAVESVSP